MSFGLNVFNADGNLILDTDLPQMALVLSGSFSISNISTPPLTPTSISHATVTNPFHFVRPQSIGTLFGFGALNSNGFTARANGPVDYKVFQISSSSYDPSLTQGIAIYNNSGTLLYNSSKNPAFIKSIQTSLVTTDIPFGTAYTSPALIKTLTITVTAYDGGLPWVNASALSLIAIGANARAFTSYCALGKWTNSTTLELWIFGIRYIGSAPINFVSGQFPRTIIAIR